MGVIQASLNVLSKPSETFAAEKPNATMMKGLTNYAVAGIVTGILVGIINLFTVQGIGIVSLIINAITNVIGAVVFSLVATAIAFILAKVLGGRGLFAQQYYLSSLLIIPIIILNVTSAAILTALGTILVISLALLVIGIYTLYLNALAIKTAHEISTLRALGAILLPVIVGAILLFMVLGVVLMQSTTYSAASNAGLNQCLALLASDGRCYDLKGGWNPCGEVEASTYNKDLCGSFTVTGCRQVPAGMKFCGPQRT